MFVSVPWSPEMFWSSNCKQHFETVLSHLWQGTQGYFYILFGICRLETGVLYRHWFILIINSYNSPVFNIKLRYGQLVLRFIILLIIEIYDRVSLRLVVPRGDWSYRGIVVHIRGLMEMNECVVNMLSYIDIYIFIDVSSFFSNKSIIRLVYY